MRKFIEEYGLAILYTIIGAICLGFFAMIFIGEDTEVSKVIGNVVDNSTNQSIEVQYNIHYNLDGGYFRVLKDQNGTPLTYDGAVEDKGSYVLISDVKQITSPALVDKETNAKYFKLDGGEKLWITYTREKSFSLPHAYDKKETINGKDYNNLLFDGWTGSGLAVKTRNAVIAKGSTGNRIYNANWTRGYYRIAFDSNLPYMKTLVDNSRNLDYRVITESGYDIAAWLSGNTPSKVVEYGSYATEELLIPKNEYEFLGHKFKYWHSDPSGDDSKGSKYYELTTLTKDLNEYNDTDSKDTQQTVTLYAQWEVIPYKINYTTTNLETASNKNPTTYRIIDQFDLNTTTEDDYQTVTWYTVNPYAENANTRDKHKFGTYSWTGPAYTSKGAPLYEFKHLSIKIDENGNKIDPIINTIENTSAEGQFQNQKISYGTYGDLNLYGYKTTGINVYEKHLTWSSATQQGQNQPSIDSKWVSEESELKEIKKEVGFEWAMSEKDVQKMLGTSEIYSTLEGLKVPGYKFDGLETSDGVLVFKANHNNKDFDATSEQVYWNTKGNERTWAYGKNLDLYVRWKPLKYLINLHSNY